MDPRVRAILAQYEEEERQEQKKSKPKTPEPPRNLEDWLERRPAGLQEWPDKVVFDSKFEISVSSVGLGSLQNIMDDLAQHARILSRWYVIRTSSCCHVIAVKRWPDQIACLQWFEISQTAFRDQTANFDWNLASVRFRCIPLFLLCIPFVLLFVYECAVQSRTVIGIEGYSLPQVK